MKYAHKIFFQLAIVSFSLGIVSCNKDGENTKEKQSPNIVFIMTDDHAKRAVSAYSTELLETPHIDRLGKSGITFDNAFVTNSICGPSRAVFLTGKFSHINGFKANQDTFDGNQATLPKYLQKAGYYTSVVGKWHLKSTPQGFDEYKVLIGQGEYYNPTIITENDTSVIEGYSTNIITDLAMDVMNRAKESNKPFFVMVHQKAPHRNWMPDSKHLRLAEKDYPLPDTFYDNYETRTAAAREQDIEIDDMYLGLDMKLPVFSKEEETGTGGNPKVASYNWWKHNYESLTSEQRAAWDAYYSPLINEYYESNLSGKDLTEWKYKRYINDYAKCIMSVDDNLGRILDYLDENDLADNTLIIYTSDQGFFLGEHGWYDKRFMYEPSLAIPLLMRYPKKMKKGIRVKELVQNLDLAPTILDAAGVDIPEDMQGKSLLQFFSDKKPGNWRKKIYYHYYQDGVWHYVKKHLGIRDDRYKLIYFYDIDDWELYDLVKDPEEVENLYHLDEYSHLTDSLKGELKGLIELYKDDTAVSFGNK